MDPQLTGLGYQALIGEGLGENRQAIATALGQGAVGVDDQQVERSIRPLALSSPRAEVSILRM